MEDLVGTSDLKALDTIITGDDAIGILQLYETRIADNLHLVKRRAVAIKLLKAIVPVEGYERQTLADLPFL